MPPETIVADGARYALTRVVAKSANLSPNYITRFCREGLVQAVRNNGLWYVNEDSLRNFLADQARQREEWNQGQSRRRKEELQHALAAATSSITIDPQRQVRAAKPAPRIPHAKRRMRRAEVVLA